MKNILVGNGINIQYDKVSYSAQNIVLRVLTDVDRNDYPIEYIIEDPIALKSYMGYLFLAAREALDGEFDNYTCCTAEREGLKDFKERYSLRKKSLRISDIGFEDYYLIHDLLCHKNKIYNPEQFQIREVLKMAYFHAIYNQGQLNELYKKYDEALCAFLKSFDNIFTTNYDSNLEKSTEKIIYHIHGQFDKLSETYNEKSFRNQLQDKPIKGIPNEIEYRYLHSTALSTYCGDYKKYQINEHAVSNEVIDKMAEGYKKTESIKAEIDNWGQVSNKLVANLSEAIKLKVNNPELRFQEDYSIKEFKEMQGELIIFGLSPYNDYHLFEMIDNASIEKCVFYYYDESECQRIKQLLSNLQFQNKLFFESTKEFWRSM